MAKHIFKISTFFRLGNGGALSQNLIEIELTDYSYPYTFEDAWEWAVTQAGENLKLENIDTLQSVTITYEGKLND